jgi:type II secretion system protein H
MRVRKGFTLIEVLLVIAIMAIVTAVTLPTFVNSIRGSRLKTAARSVTMAGRYARSMALLRQQEMVLMFDLTAGTFVVHPSAASVVSNRVVAASGDADSVTRKLERVKLISVDLTAESAPEVTEGTCSVVYRSNGLCTPYRVVLRDEHGSVIVVEVDALSTVETDDQI